MYLIYRVTLHGHFIEGSLKIYGWSSFCYVTTLINLVAISIALVEMFLICHQTLLEYTFKEVYGFMGGSPSH